MPANKTLQSLALTLPLLLFALSAGLFRLSRAAPGDPPAAAEKPAPVLLVTGIDYPGHVWRKTAPELKALLEKDARLDVRVVEDPGCLDSAVLTNYKVVLLHFMNWQSAGPEAAARENLRRFVEQGGGLMSVHFGCGAWHGEWPEFQNIVGRVWHGMNGPQHDPRGPFTVEIADRAHPVTQGLNDFETNDELYTCLVGDAPIHLLAHAKSKVDGKHHPMAFVRDYGKGRVFLTTLGHDVQAFTNSSVPDLMRRGCAWAAGLTPVPSPAAPAEPKKSAAAPDAPAEFKAYAATIPGTTVAFDMVPIPGGEFTMGSPAAEAGRNPDEGPQRRVRISPFWMGRCEVTWDEYEMFMFPEAEKRQRAANQTNAAADVIADAVSHPTKPYVEMSFGMGKEGRPAISMTQHAANKYCEWLSAKTGHFYRLPTEAEWEYACRAGTTTAYFFGDDSAALGDYAWFGGNSDTKYHKVRSKKPNPWGLHDICGNVAEWVLDQYDPAAYATSGGGDSLADLWVKATKPYPHAVRGGSWDDAPAACRSAARRSSNRTWKMQDPQIPKSIWYFTDAQFVGFRIVRPLQPPPAAGRSHYWNSGVERD